MKMPKDEMRKMIDAYCEGSKVKISDETIDRLHQWSIIEPTAVLILQKPAEEKVGSIWLDDKTIKRHQTSAGLGLVVGMYGGDRADLSYKLSKVEVGKQVKFQSATQINGEYDTPFIQFIHEANILEVSV